MTLKYKFENEIFNYVLTDEQEKKFVSWFLSDDMDYDMVAIEMNALGLNICSVKDVVKWGETDYSFMDWAYSVFRTQAYTMFKEIKTKSDNHN